jgi:branched-chain amino acid transport system permease protein
VVVGYPAIRRRGLTLAVSTLAFALLTWSYLLNTEFMGRWLPSGRIDTPRFLWGAIDVGSPTRMYALCLAVLAFALVAVRGLRASRTGRVLIAIRENDRAVRSYGVAAVRTTLAGFAISGFLAAIAGVLLVQQQHGLDVTMFAPAESLQAFSMVVIGGLGSISGAILGAVYVRGANWLLPTEWQFLATGAGLLLVLLVLPGGLGAALADLRDGALRGVARRRDIVVPSLVADRRVEPVAAADATIDPAAVEAMEELA